MKRIPSSLAQVKRAWKYGSASLVNFVWCKCWTILCQKNGTSRAWQQMATEFSWERTVPISESSTGRLVKLIHWQMFSFCGIPLACEGRAGQCKFLLDCYYRRPHGCICLQSRVIISRMHELVVGRSCRGVGRFALLCGNCLCPVVPFAFTLAAFWKSHTVRCSTKIPEYFQMLGGGEHARYSKKLCIDTKHTA